MKILVFEYVCGGGLSGQSLPHSLAAEGGMMLQALLDDLNCLAGIRIVLPLDERYTPAYLPTTAEIVRIRRNTDVMQLLPELIDGCEAVWPIAPESAGILSGIAEMAVSAGKICLSSSSAALAICGDKLATCRRLSALNLPVVRTDRLDEYCYSGERCVIKPIDGVGCQGSFIVSDVKQFRNVCETLKYLPQYVVQPYLEGLAVSLSCLCKEGKAELLCCNRQNIEIDGDRFVLRGCVVNISSEFLGFYRDLSKRLAAAVPGLWGYIGIDLIETLDDGPMVLEINPRLTTSYVGIRQAMGINVAEQVLTFLDDTVGFSVGGAVVCIGTSTPTIFGQERSLVKVLDSRVVSRSVCVTILS